MNDPEVTEEQQFRIAMALIQRHADLSTQCAKLTPYGEDVAAIHRANADSANATLKFLKHYYEDFVKHSASARYYPVIY
jgi:hypothetical protein